MYGPPVGARNTWNWLVASRLVIHTRPSLKLHCSSLLRVAFAANAPQRRVRLVEGQNCLWSAGLHDRIPELHDSGRDLCVNPTEPYCPLELAGRGAEATLEGPLQATAVRSPRD